MASVLHCGYCFDTILEHIDHPIESPHFHSIVIAQLSDNSEDSESSPSPSPPPSPKYPLFVTWKKRSSSSSSSWHLRGCIGTFTAHDLLIGLKEFSITSAFRDRRFSPVEAKEIPLLRVDVSLLIEFESNLSYLDWEVGKHGISIEFGSGRYSATYLPDVAAEQGWTQEETIKELIRKAGYKGVIDQKLKKEINLTRYQSSKASLSYEQYKTLKKQYQQQGRNEVADDEEQEEKKKDNKLKHAQVNGKEKNGLMNSLANVFKSSSSSSSASHHALPQKHKLTNTSAPSSSSSSSSSSFLPAPNHKPHGMNFSTASKSIKTKSTNNNAEEEEDDDDE